VLSSKVSGNNNFKSIIQLTQIIEANPWINLASMITLDKKRGRSLIEQHIFKLLKSIGADRKYSLIEVIELLVNTQREDLCTERLLVAPAEMLDSVPLGQRVRTIPNYLEKIIRKVKHEILLLAPFWDVPTLVDLFHCIPRLGSEYQIVLLLVHMGRESPSLKNIVNEIQSIGTSNRIRIYFHLTSRSDSHNYPHAKCLVVDRNHGYLGSANFTQRGMRGHFEVGVSLGSRDSKTLGDILQHLWTKSGLFALVWDSKSCIE